MTRDLLAERDWALVGTLFERTRAPHGTKIFCRACGRSGMAGGKWAEICRTGRHPHQCDRCDRVFSTVAAIATHDRKWREGANGCAPIVSTVTTAVPRFAFIALLYTALDGTPSILAHHWERTDA